MGVSEGCVTGLAHQLNAFLAATTLPLWIGTSEPTYLVQVNDYDWGDGSADEGQIKYHLLDRRGMVAIWEIDDFDGYAFSPIIDSDGNVKMAANAITYRLDPAFPGFACPGPVEPPWDQWGMYYHARIVFMTVALPWQPNHARSEVRELVVAVTDATYYLPYNGIWQTLCNVFDPGALAWVAEQVPYTVHEGPPPPTDPIYQAGADR